MDLILKILIVLECFVVITMTALIIKRFFPKVLKMSVDTMVKIAILSTLAYVIMLFEIPLPVFPIFLKLDISEIPVLLAAFALGPLAAVFVEFIKNFLHIFNSTSFGVGELANFIVGCALVVPAGIIYRMHKCRKFAIIGLVVGTVSMAVIGVISNYYILLPFYANVLKFPVDAVVAMGTQVNNSIVDVWTLLAYSIVPFNLLKGVVVSLIIILIYKRLSSILHKENFRAKLK